MTTHTHDTNAAAQKAAQYITLAQNFFTQHLAAQENGKPDSALFDSAIDQTRRVHGDIGLRYFVEALTMLFIDHAANAGWEVNDTTIAHFKPIADATNATVQATNATTWTGESTLRLVAEACRDISTIATEVRVGSSLPSIFTLRRLQTAALDLVLAAYRFTAEVPPAIRNCVTDAGEAELVCERLQSVANGFGLRLTHQAWQALQTDMGLMIEAQALAGGQSRLVEALKGIRAMVMETVSIAKASAPQGNPQMQMFLAELDMVGDALEVTLLELAMR